MPSTLMMALRESASLRWVLALVAGAAYGASFPTIDFTVLSFLFLVPLILSIANASGSRQAFLLGWSSGTVMWLITVPWVLNVMEIHGGIPRPTGISLYVAMAAYLGLYMAVFGFVAHRVTRKGLLGYLLLPLVWASMEYARAHLFTGFPWNLTAALLVDLPLVRVARWVGPYAIGAMVVLPSSILTWLVISGSTRRRYGIFVVGVAVYFAIWTLAGMTVVMGDVAGQTRVAVIQPDIRQEARWDPAQVLSIFDKMTSLTEQALDDGVEVVIWPESTVPLTFDSTPFYRDWVVATSASRGADVILGSVAVDENDRTKAWNSAYLVGGGEVRARYDKIKLVPFGEYVPMRRLLFFAEKLVKEVGEFRAGENDEPLVGRFRYGIAICYEIVFPHLVRAEVGKGAEILVTVTNDAWFGRSAAPRQHLQAARLRAIETDRFLLRAATTGISAVVDPNGRIVESIPLDETGIIHATVAARQTITPYVRFGDWFAIISIVATAVALFFRKRAGGQV